jgi:hypothetical protein
VPSVFIFSVSQGTSFSGFRSALVSWKRYDLLAEPPPLATNRKEYSAPDTACRSICAGRLFPEFFSSYMVRGSVWE